MTTGVGLYVGQTQSVAVVSTPGSATRTIERATILAPGPDGAVELGTRTEDSVEGFVARVGEPGGIRYAGADTCAEDLLATAMFCLFRDVATDLHGDVDVVAAHPSGWPDEAVASLRESLDYMGLKHARLISAEVAVAASTESYATDEEIESSVSDSRPGWAAAHGGALIASGHAPAAIVPELATDTFPVVPREAPTAYSQAVVLPMAESPEAAESVAAEAVVASAAPVTNGAAERTDDGKRPLLLAGAAATLLTFAGVSIALAVGYTGNTEVPEVRDATQAEVTHSPSPARGPVDFPTFTPEEVALHESSAEPQTAARTPVTEYSTPVFVPAPPPTATPPVAEPPVTEPPPADVTPDATTTPTETTTTDPAEETPTETDDPTDPPTDGGTTDPTGDETPTDGGGSDDGGSTNPADDGAAEDVSDSDPQ